MNILLTGGHSGIGLVLSKKLLDEGHQLGMVVRSEKRVVEAKSELGAAADGVDFFIADLSKREEVERVAQEIQQKWDKIDGLFNNAGVLLGKEYYSEQGNEMHYEINALAAYFLTARLKPLLDAADSPFVISTATARMHTRKELDIPNLKKPKKFVKLVGPYMNSKFALTLMMNYLDNEWSHVRFATVNPGSNKTKMTEEEGMPALLKPLSKILFAGPEKGAKFLYDAAFKDPYSNQSGIYINEGKIKPMKYQLSKRELEEMIA